MWSPSLKRDVTLIEQVQRRFTKRLRGYRDLPYHEHLNKLNLETLELRRVKSDLVLCYKIIFDIVHLNKHDLLRSKVKVTSQKHCRRGSLHSCDCRLLVVHYMPPWRSFTGKLFR